MDKETSEKIARCEQMLISRCTPEIISELKENEVLVFGSKPDGNHSSGAAKLAVEKFGAIDGVAEGLSGQSYAIPVHRHRIGMMTDAVTRFVKYARKHSELIFYVLPIGCGKANMNVSTVAEMFKEAIDLDNVYLPILFIQALKSIMKNDSGISSYRFRGRWYGLMLVLGELSGRDMKEKLKDKASEIITMLEISNEYPKEFEYINKLLIREKEKERIGENLSEEKRQKDYILGAIEAKKVYLEDKKWERLLADSDEI